MKQPGTGHRRPTIEKCRAQVNARLERLKRHPDNTFAQYMINRINTYRELATYRSRVEWQIGQENNERVFARLGK